MKFTLLALVLLIGLAAGMWLVDRFFAIPEGAVLAPGLAVLA